jgi:hypothetical protein
MIRLFTIIRKPLFKRAFSDFHSRKTSMLFKTENPLFSPLPFSEGFGRDRKESVLLIYRQVFGRFGWVSVNVSRIIPFKNSLKD